MRLTTLVMTFLCTTVAHAQQPPAFLGAPPAFKTVASTNKEKGQITFLETVVRMVPEQRARVVIRDGKQITENVTVQRPVFEQTLRLFDATKSRVITPDGKQLPIDEVWKRLKANTVVVVSADGNTPAQVYLRALSADTLVIIPGPAAPMAVPAPMPIPVPKKF